MNRLDPRHARLRPQLRRADIRVQLLFAVAGLCFAALVGRLAYIHAVMAAEGTRLSATIEQQQRATIPLQARRGLIIDAAGRVLAGSQDCPSIFADPSLIADHAEAAAKLAPILGERPEALRRRLERAAAAKRQFLWLKRRADPTEGDAVRDLDILGVGVFAEPFRRYPMASIAAHVVGFVNVDEKGLEGIERAYDSVLRGSPGSITLYRDARRRPMWNDQGSDAYKTPSPGMTVQLTIDAAIQEVVEAQVAAAIEHFQAESGVGVVMDPRTGDVLAMASLPTFDPNDPGKSPADARRNRVLTDPCEPGSTFKPFVAAAALTENVVRRGEIIYCHNGLYAAGARRLHDHHPFGNLTFEQIVIKSSNIGMAILGQRLGNERLHKYVSAPFGFGFGTQTGIGLPGEDAGIVLPLDKWTSYSTTSIPMGQEIAVTPLQLATAFCAFSNGGQLVRPRVVHAILDPRGQPVEVFDEPEIVRRAIPKDVADYMRQTVLTGVVNEGTGRRAQLVGYQVLGKTGTAQIARRNGRGYEPGAYTGSFMGAAPASDPQLAALVMIRRPKRSIGYYGGTVAAPAVREILRRALAYLEVPPDGSDAGGPPVRQVLVTD